MTPQMQQAIRMLQLSTLELCTEIQQIVEANPFLEVEESNTSSGAEQAGADANSDVSSDEFEQRLFEQANWQSSSQTRTSKSSGMDTDSWLENAQSDNQSLQDHLLWQLEMARFSYKDQIIGHTLIEALDTRGFLTDSLDNLLDCAQQQWQELIEKLETLKLERETDENDEPLNEQAHQLDLSDISPEELHVMLVRLQHFDPPGVGARDITECLYLQLKSLPDSIDFKNQAIDLIQHHGEAIASQNIKILMKQSGLTLEIIQGALALLRTLEVAPGERCCPVAIEYVIPDVIAYKHQDTWQVTLNPEVSPKVRMNPSYDNLTEKLGTQTLKSDDKDYVKNNVQEAKWFLKSLQSRHDTLLKIAKDIVACQEAFFELGDMAMKPMILADVAARVEMHESTVSRVTTQKYIHTPRGVFELKYFFSSHVSTDDGGECSSTAIRAKIKLLVSQEPAHKPLSDSKLAKELEKDGINIARRTVAKYRELDKIPASSDRKKTF